MVVIVLTVIVATVIYRRYTKRRAQKRAVKLALASLNLPISSPVEATDETLPDEVMIIERAITRESLPPPYSIPTPQLSEDPPYLTIPEPEYSGTYIRDKPPSYSSTIRRIQNQ